MTFDISTLYSADGTAKLARLDDYVNAAISTIPPGSEVVLTGPGPIWLYLCLAHALHGRLRKLSYASPVTGEVLIFDHSC